MLENVDQRNGIERAGDSRNVADKTGFDPRDAFYFGLILCIVFGAIKSPLRIGPREAAQKAAIAAADVE